MNLALLQNEAREITKRVSTAIQKAIDENRELTTEEEAAIAKDETRLAELKPQIERAQSLQNRLSALPQVAAPAPSANPTAPAQARSEQLDNGGFRNLAEFALAVRLANPQAGVAHRVDDRLAAPTN